MLLKLSELSERKVMEAEFNNTPVERDPKKHGPLKIQELLKQFPSILFKTWEIGLVIHHAPYGFQLSRQLGTNSR